MLLRVLTLTVLASQALGPQGPRDVVRRAVAAVEADRVLELWRAWEEDADRPGGDRLAVLGLGTLAHLTFDLNRADSLLSVLLPAEGEPPDEVSVRARLGLAQVARSRGRLPEADRLLVSAREEAVELGDEVSEVEALLLLASTRGRSVGPAAAEALFTEAAPRIGDDPYLGALYHCGLAEILVLSSRPVGAEADEGARLAESVGDGRLVSGCLASRASDRARRGDLDGALSDMQEVALQRRRIGDLGGLAVALQWRGFWLRSIGWLEEARGELEEAVAAAGIAGADSPRAWAYANLAYIDLAMGDAPSGAVHADSASLLFSAQGDRYGEGTLAGVLAEIALVGGDPEAARSAYLRTVEVCEPLGFAAGLVTAHIGLAHVAMSEGSWDEAERHLDLARGVAEGAGMRGRLQGLAYHRGVLAMRRGRLAEAEAELTAALRRVETAWRDDPAGGQPDWAYYYRMRLAEILATRGDPEGAGTLAREAMDAMDAWRETLSRPELRVQAFQVSEDRSDPDLGFASIVASLVTAGRTQEAFHLSERLRARSLQDRVVRIEALGGPWATDTGVADRFSPIRGGTAGEVIDAFPDGETALLVWVTGRGGEPTTLFILGTSGMQARVLAPADSIEPLVRRFEGLLGSGEWSPSMSRGVAEAVLGDALESLPPTTHRIVLVPDGPIHMVPFDALLLGESALLLDRFAQSVQPSAWMAAEQWRRGKRKVNPSVVAFGDPLPSEGPEDPLPPLPGASREARRVAGYGVGSVAFLGEAATESRLKALQPGEYGVLHFATHARLDEATLAGAQLLLTPGDGEDGVVRAGELARLRLDAGLAVLSACATGSGRIVRGEGSVGLSSALREAGVETVVLTRWPLDDRAAADLIDTFYRGLAGGLSVGDAVHSAKLKARAAGLPPSVWATLGVVGDETLTIALRPERIRIGRGTAILLLTLLASAALVGVLALGARRVG